MKVHKVNISNSVRKLNKRCSCQTIEKRIKQLQNEIIKFEASCIEAVYGIKVDINNYKRYKQG